MQNPRECALDVLIKVDKKEELSHIAISNVLEKYQFSEKRDRAFFTRLVEETKESVIDPTVGLVFSKKVADPVKKGDVLATIYGNDEEKVKQAVLHFKENYHIIEEKPTKPIMIREVLS